MTTKIPVELSSTPGIVDGSNATAITIDSSERVGVGTASPLDALHISSAVSSEYRGNLLLDDSTTGFAAGVGGQITFSAEYRSNGDHTEWAAIQGAKANSTDANYAGTLKFKTRANGGALQANMVLDDTGNVGIGTTSPTSYSAYADNLVVAGAAETGITIASGNSSQSGLYFSDGTSGTEQYIGFLDYNHSSNALIVGTSGAERMRIDSSGNVGIGTTATDPFGLGSTGKNLIINSSSASVGSLLNLESADTNRGYLFANSANVVLSAVPAISLIFKTTDTERMRIDSSGIVGIGLTTPSDNNTKCLYLKGAENVMSIRNLSTSNAGERVSIDFLDHNGTRRGYVSVDTSGTLFSTSSDYRLKNVIEPVTNGIERINKLNPVKFEWKETGKEEEGFIAHEVDEIFKDAVGGEKDAVNEDGSIDGQTMDYGRITPLLVKAIQEQQTIIEDLKTRIETLEG